MGLLEDWVVAATAYRARPRPTETVLFLSDWQEVLRALEPDEWQRTADAVARAYGMPTPVKFKTFDEWEATDV